MTELWIPRLEETYDVSNVYDVMLFFQDELDKVNSTEHAENWRDFAAGALKTLSYAIKNMSFEERQISVATNLAIMANTEDTTVRLKVENIGLRGTLQDAHCMTLSRTIPPSIALGMDVESFYPIDNPDDGGLVLTTAVTPIAKVHYIEHAA